MLLSIAMDGEQRRLFISRGYQDFVKKGLVQYVGPSPETDNKVVYSLTEKGEKAVQRICTAADEDKELTLNKSGKVEISNFRITLCMGNIHPDNLLPREFTKSIVDTINEGCYTGNRDVEEYLNSLNNEYIYGVEKRIVDSGEGTEIMTITRIKL